MTSRIFRAMFLSAAGAAFATALALLGTLCPYLRDLSRPRNPVWILEIFQLAAAILILLVIASYFLSMRVSRKIVQPLNELDLDHPLENEQYDELSPLLRRISQQQGEIKIQKNSLKRKQNELETILDHMSEGIILMNKEGMIVGMNNAAASILDLSSTIPGRNLIAVSRNPRLIEIVERALKGECEEQILTIHGSDYRVNAVAIQENRMVLGLSIMLCDVTDTSRAENFRCEFSANVSHELKTPLQSILGYAELLKNHMVRPENVDAFSEKIYLEAQRMCQLIEGIMSLTHLDEGAKDLSWEWADLSEIAQDVVSELKNEADLKHIKISLTGEKTAPMTGKKVLLHAIIRNLCDNAIKYGKSGGRVTVDIREINTGEAGEIRYGSAGRNLVLTVTDDGIGIPQEDQKRIFERFYRVDKSRSGVISGTGLGLSIVRHAVLIHHGRIRVESEPGRGSRFTVDLPKTQHKVKENRTNVQRCFHANQTV